MTPARRAELREWARGGPDELDEMLDAIEDMHLQNDGLLALAARGGDEHTKLRAEVDRLRTREEDLISDGVMRENDLSAVRAEVERCKSEAKACVKQEADMCRVAGRYRAALERIANDGNCGGMGGGLRRDGNDLRDIARDALGGKP